MNAIVPATTGPYTMAAPRSSGRSIDRLGPSSPEVSGTKPAHATNATHSARSHPTTVGRSIAQPAPSTTRSIKITMPARTLNDLGSSGLLAAPTTVACGSVEEAAVADTVNAPPFGFP